MGLQAVSLHDNIGIRPLVLGVISTFFATVFVILRFYAHRIIKAPYASHDTMILVALFFAYGNTIDHIIGVVYGGIGIHVHRLAPEQVHVYMKNLIATIVLWASALSAVKLSLLLLYVQVFRIRKFRFAAYAVIPLVAGWWLSVFLEELLLCRPLAYNWDKSIDGKCANVTAAYLAAGILNLLTDVSVLVLPIPMVLRLQLPLRTRLALLVTFCVGLVVCIISILRIITVRAYNIEDPTYSMWMIAVWSSLEPTLGIMCACAPFMRPVFNQLRGQDYSRSRLGSVADIETMNLAKRSIDDPGLHNTNASAWTPAKAVKALNSDSTSAQELRDLENHPIPSEAFIRMDRSFTIASHGSPA